PARLGDRVVRATETVPENSQRRTLDRCRVSWIDRGVRHGQDLTDPVAVGRVVERRSGARFGGLPGARIDVPRVTRREVLPPHRPLRDHACKEVIEDGSEVGDVRNLLAIVADRPAPSQPAAERVGVLLDGLYGA